MAEPKRGKKDFPPSPPLGEGADSPSPEEQDPHLPWHFTSLAGAETCCGTFLLPAPCCGQSEGCCWGRTGARRGQQWAARAECVRWTPSASVETATSRWSCSRSENMTHPRDSPSKRYSVRDRQMKPGTHPETHEREAIFEKTPVARGAFLDIALLEIIF